MTDLQATKSRTASGVDARVGRLFFLDIAGGRVLSANPDGSDLKTIVEEGRKLPDGLVIDSAARHMYWTNMGNLKANDGSILRSDLDGKNITTIVAPGGTFTPKQLQIEKKTGKLYWCDREGMRVMRANLDGSNIETLVDTSEGDPRPGPDARKWCVGIAVDAAGGKFYWTQKGDDNAGQGRIFRANIELPAGRTPANRQDIELLYDNLPEPIDLDLDVAHRMMYWTDRGDPPRGNTVNRAPMDPAPGNRKDPEIRVLPSDGRHRPGLGSERRADVHHRLRRHGLQRQSRRLQQEDLALRRRQPHRHRLRRNLKHLTKRRTDHVDCQTYSPRRHHRHRSHWRQLGGALPGERPGGRGDRCRAECRSRSEAFRRSGLAGAQEIGPCAGRITIETDVHEPTLRRRSRAPTLSRRMGPSGSISRRSSMDNSTSCCRPT